MAAVIVFDLFNRSSFESAINWKQVLTLFAKYTYVYPKVIVYVCFDQDVDNKVFLPNGENIPVLLLANKVGIDLELVRYLSNVKFALIVFVLTFIVSLHRWTYKTTARLPLCHWKSLRILPMSTTSSRGAFDCLFNDI